MAPKKEEKAGSSSQDVERSSMQSLLDEEIDRTSLSPNRVKYYRHLKYIRIVVLFLFWLTFTTILMITEEDDGMWKSISVPTKAEGKEYKIENQPKDNSLTLYLIGPFLYKLNDISGNEIISPSPENIQEDLETNFFLFVTVNRHFINNNGKMEIEEVSKVWNLMLIASKNFDNVQNVIRKNIYTFGSKSKDDEYFYKFKLQNVEEPIPLTIKSFPGSIKTKLSMILSCLLMVGMFILLFWDVTSRAIIGIIFCSLAVALMGLFHVRPVLKNVAQFVDIDYVLLLFGMTIIAGVLAETGSDLYLAVQVFRLSNGHVWPILTVLCIATAIGSAIFDKITVLVLLALLTLRICEIQQLNPANVLAGLMLFSNIGYMLTPKETIKHSILSQKGIANSSYRFKNYLPYVMQMIIPVLVSLMITYIFLRLYYYSSESMRIVEAPIVSRLRRAIRFWTHTAQSVGDYSEVEKAVQKSVRMKINRLRNRLRRLGKMPLPSEDFQVTLKRLKEKHTITDKSRIIMCGIVLLSVLIMQIGYSFNLHYISHGWTCLIFSLVLLAACNWNDFESLMTKMDWSTLLLVACIMIITKAIVPLGLLDEMGDIVVYKIREIDREYRLHIGVIILLCVSALGSAMFDTNYVCFAMAGRVIDLVNAPDANLAIEPLLLAIILGAGFGCNVTLISAISNIVCAGLAEKHGYKFYFWDFFKVGASVTIFCLILSIIYLLLFDMILGYK